jgi:hypothetical protein
MALVVGALLAVCGTGCGGGGALSAQALAKHSDALRSLAAEGALLAEDAGSGKTTSVFLREHSSDLSTSASTTETELMSATTEQALEPELRDLRRLARQVTDRLTRLGHASQREARTIGRQLETAADASKKIGDDLG